MGFLDRAKATLKEATKGMGEETVRVVDYDEIDDAENIPEPQKKTVKRAPVKKESQKKGFSFNLPKATPKPKGESKPKQKTAQQSAFDIEDDATEDILTGDNAFMNTQPEKRSNEESIKDILELLQIPATFEIESDVYLPEDLKKISFNVQVPQGYDMGEVNTFVSRTKMSITRLVELLKLRNEHIAKLATTVDRLQVDVSNMRFQSEVSNGINVMATTDYDTEELASENYQLKQTIKTLQEELEGSLGVSTDTEMAVTEREQLTMLQDEISILQRENQELQDEVYQLKTENSVLSEQADVAAEEQIRGVDYSKDTNENDSSVSLMELPELDMDSLDSGFDNGIPDPSKSSVFYSEDAESTEDYLRENSVIYETDPSEQAGESLPAPDGYNDEEDDEDAVWNSLQEWS